MTDVRLGAPDGLADQGTAPTNASQHVLTAFCQTIIDQSALPSALLVGPDFIVQCVSPAFAAMVGREAAELCGRPIGQGLAHLDTAALLAALDQAALSGEAAACRQALHPHPAHGPVAWSAMLFPLPASGDGPRALFLELQDTTAQQLAAQLADDIRAINEQLVLTQVRAHEAAEQLRDHLAFLQALTHSLHDGVCAIDLDGRLSYVNAGAERMLGRPAADLLGRLAVEAIALAGPAAAARGGAPPFAAVLRTAEPHHDDDALLIQPDGAILRISYSMDPIRGAGAVLGVVAVMHDISALRRLQATREEYMALLSHDLRSPLTTILGTAELLQRRLAALGLAREVTRAETIVTSSNRMARMIEDTLEQSALEAGGAPPKRSIIDARRFLQRVVAQLPTDADRRRISLETPDSLLVCGDASQIERTLVNLLGNALKYSPPLSAVEVRLAAHAGEAWVVVRDHGVGLHAEDLPRLFAKHYRARTAGDIPGTGLGLYGSQLMAAANGGRIWAESEVGLGSTFTLALPLAPEGSPSPE